VFLFLPAAAFDGPQHRDILGFASGAVYLPLVACLVRAWSDGAAELAGWPHSYSDDHTRDLIMTLRYFLMGMLAGAVITGTGIALGRLV